MTKKDYVQETTSPVQESAEALQSREGMANLVLAMNGMVFGLDVSQ